MKIVIASQKKERNIFLPLSCISLLLHFLPIDDKNVDGKTLREVVRCLKRFKKANGSFTLVEVEEKDGEHIQIII